MSRTIILTMAAAGIASALMAEKYPSGSGDITSPASWGLDALPSVAIIQDVNGDYTAGNSCAFGQMFFINTNSNVRVAANHKVTASDGVKISLGNSAAKSRYVGMSVSNSTVNVELNGGTYDFGGNGYFLFGGIYSSSAGIPTNAEMRITGGAVLDNLNFIQLGYHYTYPGYNRLIIEDGSKLNVPGGTDPLASRLALMCEGRAVSPHESLIIRSGGEANFGRGLYTTFNQKATFKESCNSILVTGEGSKLTMTEATDAITSRMFVGCFSEDEVRFSDHAKGIFNNHGIRMSHEANAGSNRFIVEDGAEVTCGENAIVEIGYYNGTNPDYTSFIVRNGGKFRSAAEFHVGNADGIGSHNELVVSNGTFEVPKIRVSEHLTSCSNRIVVTGPEAKLSLTQNTDGSDGTFIGRGGFNELLFDDHAQVTTATNLHFTGYKLNGSACASSNNNIRITRGAQVYSNGGIYLGNGQSSAGGLGHHNRLEVSDGASLTCYANVYIWGRYNDIVVSNATFAATNCAVIIGNARSSLNSEYNRVIMQGTNPVFSARGSWWAIGKSTVRFEIPDCGYPEGIATFANPLISGYELVVGGQSTIEVDVDDILAKMRTKETSVTRPYCLMKCTNKTDFDQYRSEIEAAITDANATLPSGCQLYIDDTTKAKNRAIWLKCRYVGGFTVTIR